MSTHIMGVQLKEFSQTELTGLSHGQLEKEPAPQAPLCCLCYSLHPAAITTALWLVLLFLFLFLL